MPIDWIMGLIGGLLIGGAAALFLLVNGRIMGASGLLGGLVDGSGRSDAGERLAMIAGLIVVPGVIALAMGGAQTHLTSNMGLIVVAGVLVGIGTRLANGCTSGHGVCGISRLSLRGIIATLIYIGAGAVTIAALRGIVGGL
ncbi:YeeE/YedE family protein [Loktanella salsilacus]|uniref:YeeE/YedE family protein n=1 Tax=Loktanella salsilacus TaxID=195913 RepID=UPI0037044C7F|nr:YeeE/YedE family protein [Alphaproteobacteria bacterium]MBU1837771.1 YeeE/YedE family protein [Alphaproteobacteria bacterium]